MSQMTSESKRLRLNELQQKSANAKDYHEKAAIDAEIVALMSEPVSPPQKSINEELDEINIAIVDSLGKPGGITYQERRALLDESMRLIAKGVVSKQEPYIPKQVKV